MEIPRLIYSGNKSKPLTIQWKGLNCMPQVSPGELSAMTNMSSKYAPCLYPRESRETTETLTSGTSLAVADGKLCWVDGTNFVYDGTTKGTVTAGTKWMFVFNGKVLIFPDKKYYEIDTGTFGNIATGTYATDLISCPDINAACVYNNRVFGLKENNIYASALGLYNTWADFSGESTDSWASDVATDGDFNGIIECSNHLILTKPNCFYELYGSKPSNFNPILTSPDIGCIDGRSLVVIGNVLYFLSRDGIYEYSGSSVKNISLNLDEAYVSGAAGTDGRRYYISLYNGIEYNLYVYDAMSGLWHREDDLEVLQFVNLNGRLYAVTA